MTGVVHPAPVLATLLLHGAALAGIATLAGPQGPAGVVASAREVPIVVTMIPAQVASMARAAPVAQLASAAQSVSAPRTVSAPRPTGIDTGAAAGAVQRTGEAELPAVVVTATRVEPSSTRGPASRPLRPDPTRVGTAPIEPAPIGEPIPEPGEAYVAAADEGSPTRTAALSVPPPSMPGPSFGGWGWYSAERRRAAQRERAAGDARPAAAGVASTAGMDVGTGTGTGPGTGTDADTGALAAGGPCAPDPDDQRCESLPRNAR